MAEQARPSLVLHGYAVSNYFNTARAALMEKGLPFEIMRVRSSREEDFLLRSPMGKIPYLQTSAGCFSETVPMLEYLHEIGDGASLYPADALQRAHARQVMNIVQLYLDLPMRRLYPGTGMGAEHLPGAIDAVAAQLDITLDALRRLFQFKPFLIGDRLSYADLMTLYCVDVGDRVTRQVYGWSLLERIPGLHDWGRRMCERESTRVVAAEFLETFKPYLQAKRAAYSLESGGGLFGAS